MQESRTEPLIIGTRGSRLALWQAEEVQRLLPVEARLEIIRTSGDRIQDVSLQGGSTTGFFTKFGDGGAAGHWSSSRVTASMNPR